MPDGLHGQRQGGGRLCREGPRPDPVGRQRRGFRRGVHRRVHLPGRCAEAHRRRRQEGCHLRTLRRCPHVRHGRQLGGVQRLTRHRVQRVVHHQLPRAAGQDHRRQLRHRGRFDDHGARHHRDAEDRGRPLHEGLARRPRCRRQHHPVQHRRRESRRQGSPRAQRQAHRHGVPRAHPGRLRRGPDRAHREGRVVRGDLRHHRGGVQERRPQGHHGIHRRRGCLRRLHRRRPIVNLRRNRRHLAVAQLCQARELVRQRVGVLQQGRRPHRAHALQDARQGC